MKKKILKLTEQELKKIIENAIEEGLWDKIGAATLGGIMSLSPGAANANNIEPPAVTQQIKQQANTVEQDGEIFIGNKSYKNKVYATNPRFGKIENDSYVKEQLKILNNNNMGKFFYVQGEKLQDGLQVAKVLEMTLDKGEKVYEFQNKDIEFELLQLFDDPAWQSKWKVRYFPNIANPTHAFYKQKVSNKAMEEKQMNKQNKIIEAEVPVEAGLSDQQKQFLQNHPDPEGALLYWKSFGDSLERREAIEILADRLGLERVAEILGKDKEKNAAMLAALEKKLKRQEKAAERTGMYTNTSSRSDQKAYADVTLGTNRTSKAPTGLGESKKHLKEELTKADVKKVIQDEINAFARQQLKKMVEEELEKALSKTDIKNKVGDISKDILKKLYKDLSLHHTYVIDRVKL